ncbi:hypothetical protein WBG78_23865 [Chryseolinea sp. T2]|uniref:BACON domain-containing protein n=1 Tax=Chryseolinea sp. T2 TaxID=3129255 RepID=UPI0030788FE9
MKTMRHLLAAIIVVLIFSCQDDRIKLPPVMASPSIVILRSDYLEQYVDLFASTSGTIHWQVIYKPEWVDVNHMSGVVNAGPIVIKADITGLLPQTLEDNVVFKTTTGDLTIPVKVTITTSTAFKISPSPMVVNFDESTMKFTISNVSTESATWQITPSAAYVAVTPSYGSLNAGETSTLTLDVDRSTLEAKTYSAVLDLRLDGYLASETTVTINN